MESVLGIHESALLFRARRMDVLAENLANVDTPNYKARDIEFSHALEAANSGARLVTTNPRHLAGTQAEHSTPLQYRVPHQPSLDGNTVESDLELARFAENAVSYQASLLFINRRIAGLRTAITGGR
jgi:flagellar basal-body rod protein FlgB